MLRIFAGLIAIVGAVQESAQAPAPEPPTVWNLEWQESHCTISTGSAKTLGFSLWMTPGDPDAELYIIGSSKVVPVVGSPGPVSGNRKSITVVLAPSG